MAEAPFQIKTLPRANEKSRRKPPKAATIWDLPDSSAWLGRALIALSVIAMAAAGIGIWKSSKKVESPRAPARVVMDPTSAAVAKYKTDAMIREQMLVRKMQLENQALRINNPAGESGYELVPTGDFGVQLEQESTMERIYEDLNGTARTYSDVSPAERINSLLANRKWLNEMEKAERVTFVRNFIRDAFDKGYEVQLDQNLVVVGIRRITSPKQVNIDKVLERLASQGY
ncbi:MAG: hypothetical protein AB7F86_18845 [Bdellovibrionales bacterium]